MRPSQPPKILALLFTVLTTIHTSDGRPNPPDEAWKRLLESRYHYLSERNCANPCGWTGQLCCNAGQTCGTNSAGQAVCDGGGTGANAQVAAGWEFFTTTYVETDLVTRTSTYSSYFGAQPTEAAPPAITAIGCNSQLGESPCGSMCCATGQYCVYAGQCAASNGDDVISSAPLGVITATNTAPLRPTSNAATTVTSTGSATTTVPFQTPTASAGAGAAGVASTTSNNGLSGGAIAGIVIGVILGTILLILLLAACCLQAGLSGLAGIFGLRNRRRREETTYIEERRHHSSHGGGGGGGGGGRRWWGAAPAVVDRPKKKSSGIGGLTAVAGGLTALGVFLGLKRRHDKKKEKSEYGPGSSYYSGYYTSSETNPQDQMTDIQDVLAEPGRRDGSAPEPNGIYFLSVER
ncbi:MAG: hypothetical protein Q9163_003497 [Psora crenata]